MPYSPICARYSVTMYGCVTGKYLFACIYMYMECSHTAHNSDHFISSLYLIKLPAHINDDHEVCWYYLPFLSRFWAQQRCLFVQETTI